jgi:hypothetical protein
MGNWERFSDSKKCPGSKGTESAFIRSNRNHTISTSSKVDRADPMVSKEPAPIPGPRSNLASVHFNVKDTSQCPCGGQL